MPKNKAANRNYLLTAKTKLWCATCQQLRAVVDYFNGGTDEAKMSCGHRRKLEVR
jgi:hypothetical protein